MFLRMNSWTNMQLYAAACQDTDRLTISLLFRPAPVDLTTKYSLRSTEAS